MKSFLLLLLLFLAARSVAPAGETHLQEISWPELARTGRLQSGAIDAAAGKPAALKVENLATQPMKAPLVVIESPKVTSSHYQVTGEIRYEEVQGAAFLEMWSYFSGHGAYFSRTLGLEGPMARLEGSSDWRPFVLPFDATGATHPLSKLELNLRLPGPGKVWLRNLKLSQTNAPATAWWSDRAAGWIGGIVGGLIGCFGSYMEWAARRGRQRKLVMISGVILAGLGAASLLAGIVALLLRQPYGVWYGLLLFGVICAAIFPFRLQRYRRGYEEQELRRMAALDSR